MKHLIHKLFSYFSLNCPQCVVELNQDLDAQDSAHKDENGYRR